MMVLPELPSGKAFWALVMLLPAMMLMVFVPAPTLAGTTVAIMPFKCTEKSSVCELWQEVVTAELARTSAIVVLEHAQSSKVLARLKEEQSMAYESDGAVRLGKLLHADYSLLGTLAVSGQRVVVTGRLVNIIDGSLSASATFEGRVDSWSAIAAGFVARLLEPVISASSTSCQAHGADKALDGDAATYWQAAASNYEGWLEVRFPLPNRFSSVRFVSPATNTGAGVPRNFAVECLKEGRWVEIVSGAGNMRLKWSGSFEARECRAWRIAVSSVIDRSRALSIAELSFE